MIKYDLNEYLNSRVNILNTGGGRGYETGVRIFDCLWCGDTRGRGFMNVVRGTAGCFNAGCPAEPYISGGALEWVRAVEGFDSITQTLSFLQKEYPALYLKTERPTPTLEYNDFCNLPEEFCEFKLHPESMLQLGFEKFAEDKWYCMSVEILHLAGAGWAVSGRYAQRIIFPIVMDGKTVGFQARSILPESKIKYLTSSHTQTRSMEKDYPPECGRPAEAMLYGIDTIKEDSTVILVEGIADVLVLRTQGRRAVGILGTRFTTEKLAILKRKKPGRVIVAFDAEAETEGASERAVRDLISWGFKAFLGSWKDGNDAGDGGLLEIKGLGMSSAMASKLRW